MTAGGRLRPAGTAIIRGQLNSLRRPCEDAKRHRLPLNPLNPLNPSINYPITRLPDYPITVPSCPS